MLLSFPYEIIHPFLTFVITSSMCKLPSSLVIVFTASWRPPLQIIVDENGEARPLSYNGMYNHHSHQLHNPCSSHIGAVNCCAVAQALEQMLRYSTNPSCVYRRLPVTCNSKPLYVHSHCVHLFIVHVFHFFNVRQFENLPLLRSLTSSYMGVMLRNGAT